MTKRKTKLTRAKKIQMIVNRLDSGDDFGTLAMEYSEDTETSGNGGDLWLLVRTGVEKYRPRYSRCSHETETRPIHHGDQQPSTR